MKDLVQCTVSRNNFQRWLDWGNAPLTICTGEKAITMLLKIEKKPVDYLYQSAVEADGCIPWKNGLTFCGVHDIRNHTLYLTESLTAVLTDGQSPFAVRAILSVVNEICGRINRRVEESIANSRDNLSVQDITGWKAARELKDYVEDGAHREALDRFFGGNKPDGQFHSGYALDQLPEAVFMAWLQDPEGFIEAETEQYIKINQEKFLLQFLKNDTLLVEYQALIQDPDNPLHRVKAISEAIKTSGAKTVTVTVQINGKELSFRTGTTQLRGRYNSYSTCHIAAADRKEFEQLFGRFVNYTAEDITRITYGRNTIWIIFIKPLQCKGFKKISFL